MIAKKAWKKVETRSVASQKRKRERPVGMRRYMIWLRGVAFQYATSMFEGIIKAMNSTGWWFQGFWW